MIENDVNSAESVTPSGVVEAVAPTENVSPVVPDTGVQQVADGSAAPAAAPAGQTEAQTEEGRIPLSRLNEVIAERDAARDSESQLREHLKLTANQPQPQVEQPQQEGLTLQVMKQMGLNPEEYVSPAEMAAVNDKVLQIVSTQQNQANQQQQFVASHTDFANVVGHADPVTGQFVYAPPLARVLQQDPSLIAALQNAGAGANALAYRIAVNDPTYQAEVAESNKPAPQVAGEAAEQAIKAAASLTSVSAVGSGAAIDKAAQIAAMSPEQFTAYKNEVMKNGGVAM